ncbi:STAS domain-containing protein, partial [Streptomyces lavendulae]|uniref:STAS domain-containing protein n=1 Tax=Streptomyces lavendulae TaxID=1914 RepID=UPI0036BCB981
ACDYAAGITGRPGLRSRTAPADVSHASGVLVPLRDPVDQAAAARRGSPVPGCIIMVAMGDQEGHGPGMWVDGGDERVVVHVGGEMDIDRAPMLYNALHIAITREGGPYEIVADLSEMSFCDSAGLNALIQVRHTAAEYGKN